MSADHSIDAFHRGAFWLKQPAARGHRAGTDAMVLAAALPSDFAGRLADLGAGAGAAGLAVLARCRAARAVLVERDGDMARFARETLALEGNAALAPRASVLECDVTLTGDARRATGLGDAGFDAAILNPPFNAAHDRPSPDALKAGAHVMESDVPQRWLRTAAAIVKPRGWLALIARPVMLAPVLAALESRFGAARIIAVHPRADAPAIRFVLRAVRASKAPLALEPPLVLHESGRDRFRARAEAINNGSASLFGD